MLHCNLMWCVCVCVPVLVGTDDAVHPLLFACETRNPIIVKIALSSMQKLIQYKAVPQVSKRSFNMLQPLKLIRIGKTLNKFVEVQSIQKRIQYNLNCV